MVHLSVLHGNLLSKLWTISRLRASPYAQWSYWLPHIERWVEHVAPCYHSFYLTQVIYPIVCKKKNVIQFSISFISCVEGLHEECYFGWSIFIGNGIRIKREHFQSIQIRFGKQNDAKKHESHSKFIHNKRCSTFLPAHTKKRC